MGSLGHNNNAAVLNEPSSKAIVPVTLCPVHDQRAGGFILLIKLDLFYHFLTLLHKLKLYCEVACYNCVYMRQKQTQRSCKKMNVQTKQALVNEQIALEAQLEREEQTEADQSWRLKRQETLDVCQLLQISTLSMKLY